MGTKHKQHSVFTHHDLLPQISGVLGNVDTPFFLNFFRYHVFNMLNI